MAERRDESNEPGPFRKRAAAVTIWVWIPALVAIGIIVWLVVLALT